MSENLQKLLLIPAFVGFIFSFGMLDGIGLLGLMQFGLFMVTGGYIIVWFTCHWTELTEDPKKRARK